MSFLKNYIYIFKNIKIKGILLKLINIILIKVVFKWALSENDWILFLSSKENAVGAVNLFIITIGLITVYYEFNELLKEADINVDNSVLESVDAKDAANDEDAKKKIYNVKIFYFKQAVGIAALRFAWLSYMYLLDYCDSIDNEQAIAHYELLRSIRKVLL